MNLIDTLRVNRIRRNLTQKQLAYIADVSQVTLSHIENGVTRPKQETREKIEKVVGRVDWERTYDEGTVRRQTIKN